MTVSTTSSSIIVAATGANSYQFPFIAVASSDVAVSYTNTSGTTITLPTTAYTVAINAPLTGSIWGVGGTVSPVTPATYSSGSLTISRVLPFTQSSAISNQGNEYPIVTEQALDTLCMEIQQVAGRTGQYRGVWATTNNYNYGDFVQDGVNGAFTNNIYLCANTNTSGVWATDLAAGYWVLALNVQSLVVAGSYLPLSGGTVSGNLVVTGTTTLANTSAANLSASGTVSGAGFTALTASLAPKASPTFTGTVTTANLSASGTVSGAGFTALIANLAPKDSPSFSGVPLTPTGAARAGGLQIASQAYADSAAHFGGWVLSTYAINTVYQAATDGLVVVSGSQGGGGENGTLLGYSDSSNPPTAQPCSYGNNQSSGNWLGGFTMPVRKGDYWKVVQSGNFSGVTISWLPIGN